DERPAGFSRKWLHDLLRGQLGFDGAIFTDDLSMEAGRYIAGRQLGFAEAALEALAAGCDLALLCNQSLQPQLLDDFLASMERAAASGALAPDAAREARRRALLPTALAPAWDELQASLRYQHALRLMDAAK
ncbi:MAG: beta-N-acetylhexosaminidase, partial [Comamonadaceae bacterium]